jgi:SAM-dependent methyltransferase
MTAEIEFYKRHYGGGVAAGATPLDRFEREMLARGKRYGLVTEYLSRQKLVRGCLAEIGCGGAEALLILSRRFRFDRIVGIDIASDSDNEDLHGIEFLAQNLNDPWSFADGSVDYLIAMMVIEHLFDPFFAFKEINRTLSSNGAAFVNLPLVTGIKNRVRLLFGYLPVTSSAYEGWFEKEEWDGNHLHYFSMHSIHDLARKAGLRVAEVRGVGAFHECKSWAPSLLAGEVTFLLERKQ